MSHPTDAHADDGAVHAHISSVPFYVAIFLGLLVLTGITVGQSYVDLGSLSIAIVILIATMKASLVVTFFMHLKWDNKFNVLMFLAGILFIGVFFAYTMNDTNGRGDHDPDQNVKVWAKTGEVAPGGFVSQAAAHGSASAGGAHEAPPASGAPDPHGAVPVPQH